MIHIPKFHIYDPLKLITLLTDSVLLSKPMISRGMEVTIFFITRNASAKLLALKKIHEKLIKVYVSTHLSNFCQVPLISSRLTVLNILPIE